MAFTKLIVGGFKSLRDRTEIPLAPLTLMFGPNSSGKSAVLRAASVLRGILGERLRIDADSKSAIALLVRVFVEGPPAYVHRLPIGEDCFVTPVLGLELDSFNTEPGTAFPDDRHDVPARRISLDLFWQLNEARVQLELELGGIETVVVDGEVLMQDVSSPTALKDRRLNPFRPNTINTPEHSAVASRRAEPDPPVLTLVIDHPLWQKNAQMAAALRALRKAAARAEDTVEFLALEGNRLSIRLSKTYLFNEDPWVRMPPAAPLDAMSAGTTIGRKLARLADHVETVCEAAMFLRLQMEHIAYCELDVAHVSGDRCTLTTKDVSASGGAKEEDTATQHYATWMGKPRARRAGGSAPRTATQRYAIWLGELHSETEDGKPGPPTRDDFVNDALASNLFGARRYRVKPAVSRVEVTGLIERARDDYTEEEWLDVTLFLEDSDGRRFDFADVGSGLSYLLPVMATLWESKLSWVEQPELHLHPAAQCEIGDMFIRAFNRGRFSIIETHSEHLLLRVLRRIRGTVAGKVQDAELRCPPEAVCVLYFEPTENGSTKVHRLRVSRAGDFMDRWPSGFFEERDRELFDE